MKKIILFALAFSLFASFLPAVSPAQAAATADAPGAGFASGDPCGFLMGTATPYPATPVIARKTVELTAVADRNQACADANGYFYGSASRNSYAQYSVPATPTIPASTQIMNFKWSSVATNNVVVDQSTGAWRGYAQFSAPTTIPASPTGQRLVWFDWTCQRGSACYGLDTSKYRVHTNMTTGAVTGYAWSDYYGWISFNGLTQELAPRQIMTYVDILAGDTESGPQDVNATTAPLADGYQYYRVRVQFQDQATGAYLTWSDFDLSLSPLPPVSLDILQTTDSNVWLNQVNNTGNAILETYENPAYDPDVSVPVGRHLGCERTSTYCIFEDADGALSFYKFVVSGAPTSNVLGLNNDTDASLEYFADRDGCRSVYYDQWKEVDALGAQPTCPAVGGSLMDKAMVFYERENARNKYEIDGVSIVPYFATGRTYSIQTYGDVVAYPDAAALTRISGMTTTSYYYSTAANSADLSFRPRYQITKFVAAYDGAEHAQISTDAAKIQTLKTEATIASTSDEFQLAGGATYPGYTVNYQLDADSNQPRATGDSYLLMDTSQPVSPTTVEGTHRSDVLSVGTAAAYSKNYSIDYGQKASECVGGCPASTGNVLSNPTAEQWVCDDVGRKRFSAPSCYYTEYLSHIDRHTAAEDMLVVGAINSGVDAEDFLNSDYVSVLGAWTDTFNQRNLMFSQVARFTQGQNPTGAGVLRADGTTSTTGIVELGHMLFAKGNVTIEGYSSGVKKTLVLVGGDVFVTGDINSKLGIIAFKSGGGGNLWISPSVSFINANMFLDGSVFSYDGVVPTSSYPTCWSDDEERKEALKSPLQIKGSITSRNTVNGAADPGAGSWDRGDGTMTTNYSEAREYDLNLLREYRLCYSINGDGSLGTTTEACNEGEVLTQYLIDHPEVGNPPLVIEYDPPDELPVFNVGSGMFN